MAGMNWRLAFAVGSTSLSAFQHGYNTRVVQSVPSLIMDWLRSGATDLHTHNPYGDRYLWFFVVTIFGFGGIIGAMFTGMVADRFGRKLGLLLSNIFVFAGALLQGLSKPAHSAIMLILGRFLIGVNSGLASGLAPMYLAEISPVTHRGYTGTVYNLVMYISILLPGVIDFYQVWPWRLAATAVPALLQCLTLSFCPESPKFLLSNKGQVLEAQKALYWLQGDVAVHGDTETPQEAEKTAVGKKVTVLELVRNRQLRQPLLIAVMVMAAHQLTGVYSMSFATYDILLESHIPLNFVHVTLIMIVMTVVSMFLVDRAGRRVLLLTGLSGMFVATALIAVAMVYRGNNEWVPQLCIAMLLLFVVMYPLGPASIPWFLVHELFDQSSRATAASVVVPIHWIAYFIFTSATLDVLHIPLGHLNTFVAFAVLQVVFIVFIYFKVPETKKKTEEEISALFK